MKSKAKKITFWTTTTVFSAMMTLSGIMYLTNPEVQQGFVHLGFPSYFRVELAVFKFLGAAVLLLPFFPKVTKEWAYAGFGITLTSAFIAHLASGDEISKVIAPVVFAALLVTSYKSRE